MSCDHIRAEVGQTCSKHHGMKEDGRLCDIGFLEVISRAFEHYVCDAEAEDLIGSFEHLTGFGIVFIYVFGHAGILGSLTWEYIGSLHILHLFSRCPDLA